MGFVPVKGGLAGTNSVLPVYKGNFAPTAPYKVGDLVSFNGAIYITKQDWPKSTDLLNLAYLATITTSPSGVTNPDNVTDINKLVDPTIVESATVRKLSVSGSYIILSFSPAITTQSIKITAPTSFDMSGGWPRLSIYVDDVEVTATRTTTKTTCQVPFSGSVSKIRLENSSSTWAYPLRNITVMGFPEHTPAANYDVWALFVPAPASW